MRNFTILTGIALVCSMTPALSQEIRIGDLRAHLYLESSGRLSDDLLVQKNVSLKNVPRGEGAFSEPANTVVFNVTFLGARNTQPKFASALVNITTTNRTGQRKRETRPLLGFVFGDDGKVNRPIIVENATCSMIEIEIKAKGGSKKAELAFECVDPKTAEADEKSGLGSGKAPLKR